MSEWLAIVSLAGVLLSTFLSAKFWDKALWHRFIPIVCCFILGVLMSLFWEKPASSELEIILGFTAAGMMFSCCAWLLNKEIKKYGK